MAHVFRLYTAGGNDNIEGWNDSNGYGTKAISSINDPEGGSCKREITSIPSPFARIDLMKNAFRQVVESKDLDNKETIYHKLVSDCLDVAEIFFNIEKLRDKFDIITWNKESSLKQLLEGGNPAHKQFGETLVMYLNQDAKAYNFDLLKNIYLLNYKGPDAPSQLNTVGATSPVTLFFTSANNLNYVSDHVRFGNDKPFDSDFQPLYKRDPNFILYWFGLKNYWNQLQKSTERSFSDLFKEVDEYLDLTYRHLPQELKDRVNVMTEAQMVKYKSIPIVNRDDLVEVLGCELKCLDVDSPFCSDFVIDSDFSVDGKKPLVLPVDIFRKPLIYTQDPWDDKIVVPVHDKNKDLSKRKLPVDGRTYPYLTMGDFLEDVIICNTYPLNETCFYNGGDKLCSQSDGYSYLLPIKKEYFKYFTIDDLKKHFRIERRDVSNDKTVKVTLEIPIKEQNGQVNYVTYERFYYETNSGVSDEKNGRVIVKDFGLYLFPFLKVKNNVKADYRVNVMDFAGDDNYDLHFGDGKDVFEKKCCLGRNRTEDGEMIKPTGGGVFDPQTFVFDKAFSYIVFDVEGVENIIIPEFHGKTGAQSFEFAVDFGTSNTHIECRKDGGKIEPFTISEDERMIQPMSLNYGKDSDNPVQADFLPNVIGKSFKFPTRTVLSEKIGIDWLVDTVTPMAETNLPFVFETFPLPPYNKSSVDLKWANEQESRNRICSYFENLIILMRNKVLMNGGDLSATKLAWFYPASMSSKRVKEIEDIWIELYALYFGGDPETQIVTMSESIVPYYYYKKNNKATTNVVSVDIGGGTSDILLVKDGIPLYLSSCRFAANSIFDCQPSRSNPFISKYIDTFRKILDAQTNGEVMSLVDSWMEEDRPASDIVMLLFSLVRNKDIVERGIISKVNYSSMLFSDSKLKILFLLFYTALIYHIAKIMKGKLLDCPRHLAFSGTGSKILQILVSVREKGVLEEYTKLIFEKVYGEKYDENGLDILINTSNPKEVTCKGGLLEMKTMSVAKMDEMKVCLLGTKDILVPSSFKYADVDSNVINGVVNEINAFTDLFYELNKEFSFNKRFGVTKDWESLRPYFSRDIAKSVKDGISRKDGKDEVEETLFFYPIREILCAIGGSEKMLEPEDE